MPVWGYPGRHRFFDIRGHEGVLEDAEFAHYLNISEASLSEVQSVMQYVKRIGVGLARLDALCARTEGVARQLHAFKLVVRSQTKKPRG